MACWVKESVNGRLVNWFCSARCNRYDACSNVNWLEFVWLVGQLKLWSSAMDDVETRVKRKRNKHTNAIIVFVCKQMQGAVSKPRSALQRTGEWILILRRETTGTLTRTLDNEEGDVDTVSERNGTTKHGTFRRPTAVHYSRIWHRSDAILSWSCYSWHYYTHTTTSC